MIIDDIIEIFLYIIIIIAACSFICWLINDCRKGRELYIQNEKSSICTFGDFKAVEAQNPYRTQYMDWFKTNGYEVAEIKPNPDYNSPDYTNNVHMIFRKIEAKNAK